MSIKNKMKTLLLDLDETLIHSCKKDENPDVVLKLEGVKGDYFEDDKVPIKFRPYLMEFL